MTFENLRDSNGNILPLSNLCEGKKYIEKDILNVIEGADSSVQLLNRLQALGVKEAKAIASETDVHVRIMMRWHGVYTFFLVANK